MEWLTDALREPVAELAEVAVISALAVLTARIRGRQKRAHRELQDRGVLARPDAPAPPPANRSFESSSNTPRHRRPGR